MSARSGRTIVGAARVMGLDALIGSLSTALTPARRHRRLRPP